MKVIENIGFDHFNVTFYVDSNTDMTPEEIADTAQEIAAEENLEFVSYRRAPAQHSERPFGYTFFFLEKIAEHD